MKRLSESLNLRRHQTDEVLQVWDLNSFQSFFLMNRWNHFIQNKSCKIQEKKWSLSNKHLKGLKGRGIVDSSFMGF